MSIDSQLDLVPVSEASIRLGLSREIVVRRIQCAALPGARVGGKWFVRSDALPRQAMGDRSRIDHLP